MRKDMYAKVTREARKANAKDVEKKDLYRVAWYLFRAGDEGLCVADDNWEIKVGDNCLLICEKCLKPVKADWHKVVGFLCKKLKGKNELTDVDMQTAVDLINYQRNPEKAIGWNVLQEAMISKYEVKANLTTLDRRDPLNTIKVHKQKVVIGSFEAESTHEAVENAILTIKNNTVGMNHKDAINKLLGRHLIVWDDVVFASYVDFEAVVA